MRASPMGGAVPEAGAKTDDFTPEQVERSRAYHRPQYVVFLVDLVIGLGVLGVMAFWTPGDLIYRVVRGLPWWGAALAFSVLTVGISTLVRLPTSFWRSYVHEKRWGFSTQSVGGWLVDRAKGVAVGASLTGLVLFGFIGLARAVPSAWPLAVAAAASAFVLFMSFVAPVVLEPIFNKFAPLSDQELSDQLRTLAMHAKVPVRDVLVSDASRRTTKENAYVSGLGKTRRVVIYDTLLRRADRSEVALVVAHELGHRRARHVAKGTLLGMAGSALVVTVIWAVLRDGVLRATGATGPGDPRVVPFLLFSGSILQLIGMPFESALSRRWESAADRFSLELTRELAVFARTHRDLAVANLSDLDPPRLLYLMAFSHPTPPERIAAARRWMAARTPDEDGPVQAAALTQPTQPTTG